MVNIPNKFLQDPEWKIVEQCIQDALDSVDMVPDSSTSPTDFKAQVLANKKFRRAMEDFLGQVGVVIKSADKNPWC